MPDPYRLTLPHRIWRRLPAQQRRWLATRAIAAVAPAIDRLPPRPEHGLAVAGEISRATGLGEGARLMLRALEVLGVKHWSLDIGNILPGAASDLPVPATTIPPPGAPLLIYANPPLLPLTLLRLPRALVRGRRIIGDWSWELPAAPADWRIGARFVHEVWVPSEFTAQAIEPLVPGKVRVVPRALALTPPQPSTLDRAAFGLPHDAVVVLSIFNLASSFERKNPLGTIAAFRAAFDDRRDRILLLKIANPSHFPDDFRRIAAAADAPNIRLDVRTLPMADLHALMASCDIVLSLHRSEGFGLVPAEAMLLGKPVVATGWSGNMNFMDKASAALVGFHLVPAQDSRGVYGGSDWAEPDQADAIAHLRRLADDPGERDALGLRARAAANERLGANPLIAALRSLGLTG